MMQGIRFPSHIHGHSIALQCRSKAQMWGKRPWQEAMRMCQKGAHREGYAAFLKAVIDKLHQGHLDSF